MRVFVFALMLAIGLGGTLGGYRLITGKDLVTPSDFGLGRSAASAQDVASPTPSTLPSPAPTAVPLPTPVPPTAEPSPEPPKSMVVANSDGMGVYLRRTPKLDDRLRAWVEGTRMEAIGAPVEGDGTQWQKVRAPDGSEGYIPVQYLSPAP